ncbi:MAG: iron ABC transporter substrate-binding protein [Acidimicrobiia bacterium]|nr:iron ABC transporter substrate-binding protein [Acidimicrobiia bacterium]
MRTSTPIRTLLVLVVLALVATACSDDDGGPLTVYSGRNEELVGPLLDRFTDETGIEIEVRYGDSPELAATIREEGTNSPADVFFAQDPASLGAVAELLTPLPGSIVELVPARFSDATDRWVGVSGRSRVVVYDTRDVDAAELPDSVFDLTDPVWHGRVAVAPTNGSFVAFVAAMILTDGEDRTREWLEAMAAAGAPTYPKNSVIVAAVDDGEVDAGLVNHYYLFRRIAELGDVEAANHFLAGGPGALVMPAGVGILATTDQEADAQRFVEFLLSQEAQQYFSDETFEYPLLPGVAADPALPPIETLAQPDIDLSALAGALDRATDLIAEAGLL